jgi:hypothetical protein
MPGAVRKFAALGFWGDKLGRRPGRALCDQEQKATASRKVTG